MSNLMEAKQLSTEEIYQNAVELYTHFISGERIYHIRQIFEELGDYKDAPRYLKKCDNYIAHRPGQVITFGNYHGQDIHWKVLSTEANRCLLLSEKPVDYVPFHPERVEVAWNNCTLRKWLNRQFLEEAFSLQERMMIVLSAHSNNTDFRWATGNGPDTKDKAFVFNLKELDEYLPDSNDRAIGEWWWLRGHGSSDLNQHAVYIDGTVYTNGVSSDSIDVGVRPAMWIRLNSFL